MSSIRVYLTPREDEITNLPGFESRPTSDRVSLSQESFFAEYKLYRDNGRCYIQLSDVADSVPEEAQEIVESISFKESFPISPRRETGIYRYASATAEISRDNSLQWVNIRAKKMEHLRKLYFKIRAGDIRPKPSHEGEQGGKSQSEFKAALEQAQRIIGILHNSLRLQSERFEQDLQEMRRLNDDMEQTLRLRSNEPKSSSLRAAAMAPKLVM